MRFAGELAARAVEPARIGRQEALLKLRARLIGAAGEAADVGQRAVQLDDLTAAGRVVQAIDVLGDEPGEKPADSIAASARCAAFGRAPLNRSHPSVARAQ